MLIAAAEEIKKDQMPKIKKRDERIVEYDRSKINNAIWKAVKSVGGTDYQNAVYLTSLVEKQIKEKFYLSESVDVETIQDIVEEILIKQGHDKVAKSYILYRQQHASIRELGQQISETKVVDDYIGLNTWKVKENSNQTFSLQGLNNHISSTISQKYWLDKIYPPEVRNAHNSGDFHIHDLGLLATYCVGWDLKDLLVRGFTGVEGKISSAPAKHFRSLLGQIVNFFYTLQGESAGAQAFSSFDTLIAPYIYYDKLNYAQVKQSLQEFVFNMNVPTRVGFQTPFTNITMDLKVPEFMKHEPAIVGGQMMEKTYGEFQDEMDMLNQAYAEIMCEGDALGRVFTFPIPTYNITEDFEWNNPKYNKVWEMTAKYGIPYFSNFIGSDMKPEDVRSMCPLHPDTQIIVRNNKGISIRTIKDIHYSDNIKNEILCNGEWIEASTIVSNAKECVEVVVYNGTSVVMDVKHEQPIKRSKGETIEVLRAKDIVPGMWVPFNSTPIKEDKDNYLAGYAVGAYVGNGSFEGQGTIVYSLNTDKKIAVKDILGKFFTNMGFIVTFDIRNELLSLKVRCDEFAAENWIEQFVDGNCPQDKKIKLRSFKMGKSFLQGILDGWYDTDGGNKERIYTSSTHLVEDFKVVCSLLGYAYKIGAADEREDRLSDKPVYTLKYHTRPSYNDNFFFEDGYYWFKVEDVVKSDYKGSVFCFVVKSEESLFQLANGLVTHNCRLRIDNTELQTRGGGLFGSNPLTGSIGVVTINLPRLGYLSTSEDDFYSRLANIMDIAKESLEIKRKVIEKLTEESLYPYSKFYLQDIKCKTNQYWANHFSTIGLVGMNEACINLFGEDISSSKGYSFAKDIMYFMRERIKGYQNETGNLYNLEATPAEGCSYTLLLKDNKLFGQQPYKNYTNSTQLPVDYTRDIFTALKHQEPLQTSYTGGTVFHTFLGESPSAEAAKKLIYKMCYQFKLPYYSLTPTFSICPEHGYLTGEHFTCPTCSSECEVYSRVVGYLRPVKQWNQGKQAEYSSRTEFTL